MAETIEEYINLEEVEMKDETVFKEEEILPSSTVENICTVYVQGEGIKEEECELKKEIVYIKDKVITPSTVENTCTVYVQGEKVKMENSGIQGKHLI